MMLGDVVAVKTCRIVLLEKFEAAFVEALERIVAPFDMIEYAEHWLHKDSISFLEKELRRFQPEQRLTRRLIDRGRGEVMLGERMDIAETALERASGVN